MTRHTRDEIWSSLPTPWDVIIIGGGITGAGLLNLAARQGLRALLLEANDYSFGTSSRSSKLVHGGMRYLRNRQFSVTRESVREREHMLREAPHLVTPLRFLFPYYPEIHGDSRPFQLGVLIYDLLAPKWAHRYYSPAQLAQICPPLLQSGMSGGNSYYDAVVDDSRLVLRLIFEAARHGAAALNYAAVTGLLRDRAGRVCGVAVEDRAGSGRTLEISARVVINAAGPWSDDIRAHIGAGPRLRPLAGSHLVFSRQALPLQNAVSFMHPRDHRFMFAIPWEGATLIGTTDLDHHPRESETEPRITPDENAYLLEAARHYFPSLGLDTADILSTFAGIRPVIHSGAATPGKESRRHVVWDEDGLITVTGGKLTIFRIMAAEALELARARLGQTRPFHHRQPVFDPLPVDQGADDLELPLNDWLYLAGRYGADAPALLLAAQAGELETIHALPNRWAELRWAARSEQVVHLDDLLLRRVRLGLLAPSGGQDWLEQIRSVAQPELGWDDARWQDEVARYGQIWQDYYSCPTAQANWPQSSYNKVHTLT